MLFRKYVSQEFFDEMSLEFPETIKNKPYRAFVMYCIFGLWFNYGDDKSKIPVNQRVCAILEDKLHLLKHNNYVAHRFLTRIKEDILPELEWSDYSHEDGLARVIINIGFSDNFKLAIQREYDRSLNPDTESMVHYFTQTAFASSTKQLEDIKEAKILEKHIDTVPNLCDAQILFLDYLNGLPTNSFTKIVKKNFQAALKVASQIENEQSRRLHLERLLPGILQSPRPTYAPRLHTTRLFAVGPSITYLKRDVRKALTKGWVEFDIQNAHLAIVAKDWGIPELTAVLKLGISIWDYLSKYYPNIKDIKPAIKTAIYALIFGDSKDQIINGTVKEKVVDGVIVEYRKENGLIHKMSEPAAKLFFTIPIIDIIYKARQKELQNIKYEYKQPTDCFGKEINYTQTEKAYMFTNERRVLAQRAQSVELKMLEPIIEYSKTSKFVCLVALYQFDGFSVCVKQKSRVESHINKISKLLNDHIKTLGYDTTVTYEILK